MQIPILNGIYTDEAADFRTSYPRNLVPVPKEQGVSKGYLRPAPGIVSAGVGPGVDRGGINWNGVHYRVMGTSLIAIASNGAWRILGDVGGTGQVTFDYSFDNLAIASSGRLFYWSNTALTEVTDADLGTVVDVLWVDGYFMTTDGTSLVVTELNDPYSVNPLKYGSSEADPDPIKGIVKLRNEVYAVNRYTIEVFDNIGGDLFPFSRIEGAQMQRGAIGTFSVAVFAQAIAFVGSGRNESPAVWLGLNSQLTKISTREIDQILKGYSEADLATIVVEAKVDENHQHLMIHLPDQTLVYDASATEAISEPVWFVLTSSLVGTGQYRAKNLVWCYDQWYVGDPTTHNFGKLVDTVSSHYGDVIGWDFGTQILYNDGMGAIIHELELVCLSGRVPVGEDPTIWTSYSLDGEVWSMEKPRKTGKIGERNVRISWLQQGSMRHWRIQKFRGTSDSFLTMARLEARLEALYV
jgi:hypothetical protein